MKRSLKNLLPFTIRDPKNNKGRIKDFLLDEDTWIIKYLEIDFGPELMGKRTIISNKILDKPDWGGKYFSYHKGEKRNCSISRT